MAESKALTKKSENPLAHLNGTLSKLTQSLKVRLPAHVEPDVMIRAAVACAQKVPKLLECSERSWMLAMLNAAETGLIPGTAMQHAALVPYGGEVVFMPMYRGLITLARQSGEVDNISAHVVYTADKFSVDFGNETLTHIPDFKTEDRGEPYAVYARAKLTGSDAVQFEVLSKADVKKIEASSKGASKPDSAWKLWPDEQWKKSAIKRLSKYLPLSTEKSRRFAAAIGVDNQAETGEIGKPELAPGELPMLEEKTATEELADELLPPDADDVVETTASSGSSSPASRSGA